MEKRTKRRNKKNIDKTYKYVKYKIYAFALFLAMMSIVSVLNVFRPAYYKTGEKVKFPSFTIEKILNGEYFHAVQTWYEIRFPFQNNLSYEKIETNGTGFLEKERMPKGKILFGENTYELNGLQMIIMPNMNIRKEKMLLEMEKAEIFTPETKMIALTFDDGPSEYTNRLLDILSINGAKATFYLVGSRIDYFPDTIKKMDQLKMEFGNHTFNHKYLTNINAQEEYIQLNSVDEKLMNLVEKETKSIRPPGGKMDDKLSVYINKPLILWSVDPMDWSSKNKELIAEHILEHAKDGDIILLHDLYETTVDAMEIVIPELKRQGYELVTVSKIAETKGYRLEAKAVYSKFPMSIEKN